MNFTFKRRYLTNKYPRRRKTSWGYEKVMNMGGKIATDLEIRKLKRLYKKGYSALEIAYNINRPVSFVKKYIKKIENKK